MIEFPNHKFESLNFDNAGLPNPGGLFLFNSDFLRMNESHRSASSSRQRIDHPPESLTTRLVPVEVDLKQQIFDVCSSLNNGHSPKGRLRQLCAITGSEKLYSITSSGATGRSGAFP
ncbi:hypothetical protein SAMN05444169_2408 [Bradyrhizobium erythrophlei]|jgi:hypothetical protein|uniref:Uncharacterized protein n=1 Tax=Bradyrhizobium erythrophlei TaxID=1437360 RepID=A0A1M5JQ67_9BRAD|nr:hypothetical protein SAMN05444169_2408 [Bradyrhizobium erythrophlei]